MEDVSFAEASPASGIPATEDAVTLMQWLQDWSQDNNYNVRAQTTKILEGINKMTEAVQTLAFTIKSSILNGKTTPAELNVKESSTSTRSMTVTPELTTEHLLTTGPTVGLPKPPPMSTPSTVMFASKPYQPLFRGTQRKHPMKFLEEFEIYFRQLNYLEDTKLEVLLDCIRGDALDWVDVYKEHWTCFNDFRRDFIQSFWSETQQTQLRHAISNETWNVEEESMSKHFSRFVSRAKQLMPPMPEYVLLSELIRHFPQPIQSLWQLQSTPTIRSTFDFLQRQEAAAMPNPAVALGHTQPSRAQVRYEPYKNSNATRQYAGKGDSEKNKQGNGMGPGRKVMNARPNHY